MSTEINRIECPDCIAVKGSTTRENLVVYTDGAYCMACGYVDKTIKGTDNTKKEKKVSELIPGGLSALPERGLTIETCQRYNIRVNEGFNGYIGKQQVTNASIKIFSYYDNGRVVKQKIKDKACKTNQSQRGDTSCKQLFGQHAFSPTKNVPVIITEGEEDAASAFQMSGLPCVSISNGSNSAYKDILNNLEWLTGFKSVILCFDNDEPGKKATEDCINIFEPGTVRVCTLPLKDANEMLLANKGEEFKKLTWNADFVRPATVVGISDIMDKILTKPVFGRPWPWPSMTKATYGMRLSELYLLAADTGVGKTEFVKDVVSEFLDNQEKVGLFSFEQEPAKSIQRYIGSIVKSRIYIPGKEWDEEKIRKEAEKLDGLIHLYDPASGSITIESVLIQIRWLYKCYGTKFFVIDNLKALAVNSVLNGRKESMHEYASHCMGQFFQIVKQLNITIFVLNHLAEDKIGLKAYVTTSPKNEDAYLGRTSEQMNDYINRPGLTWESGRMPTLSNIFGGGNIKALADYIIVLARNRMSEDEDDRTRLRVKFLKTRLDSDYENKEFSLYYDSHAGKLIERSNSIHVEEHNNCKDIAKGLT